jgi:hypothetical protein
VILSLPGETSRRKRVPKKTPMIVAATSPTETMWTSMPTGAFAASLRRLGANISGAWRGFRLWVATRGAPRGPRSGSTRSSRKRRATSLGEILE